MIEDEIKKIAVEAGADLVGICSAENIKDRDFSDPNYLLPGAKSVISIAVKMDDEIVGKYLSKEDYLSLCHEEGQRGGPGHYSRTVRSPSQSVPATICGWA